jgi:ribose 5-phosphate isomerase B
MKRRRFLQNSLALPGMAMGARIQGSNPSPGQEPRMEQREVGMNIVVGGDHAGFQLKGVIIQLLKSWKYTVKDCGSFTPDPVDFPDIALLMGNELKSGRAARGVMVCGTGVGAAIAGNKIPGIRAALCHDHYSAHQCVEHDNVNLLCLGAQIIGPSVAEEILVAFLNAKFSTEEQFRRRVQKLNEMDKLIPE